MIKLGVLFGGVSVEHDISILSAVRVMNNLNTNKYEIIPLYIDKEGTWYTGNALKDIENYKDRKLLKKYLKKITLVKDKNVNYIKSAGFFSKIINDIDFILPIVHGSGVEDGTIQGYLDTVGIGYAFSDLNSSVIGQDKAIMKQLLEFNKVNVVKYCFTYESNYRQDENIFIKQVEEIGYPVIVKPASLGSSIGIQVAKDKETLKDAINEAFLYEEKVIVEKVVDNLMELNCSVLGNRDYVKTSAIDKTVSNSEFFTFEEKYIGKGKKGSSSLKGMAGINRELPAKISEEVHKQVEALAIKTFDVLNNSGLVRVDFLVDSKTQEVYVNEVNTIPGDISFYLWEEKGIKFNDLLDEIITIGIKNHKKRNNKIKSFDNNVFENLGKKGFKGMKNRKSL